MEWVWHLGGLSVRELARRVWRQMDEDDVTGTAAQLSFYSLLALFPLLIVVATILGHVFAGNAGLYSELQSYMARVMPITAYDLLRGVMDEITKGASDSRLSIGLLATLWTASSGMEAAINGLNVAYRVHERRAWWRRRLVAMALTVLMALISGIALTIVLAGGRLGAWMASQFGFGDVFGSLWLTLQLTFPPLFMILMFTILYRYAPNVRAHGWQALMPGVFVGVGLWLTATTLFRVYLSYFDTYSKTYGSLGAVIVLLLWLYLSSAAILIGGEVNSQIRRAAAAAGAVTAQSSIEGSED